MKKLRLKKTELRLVIGFLTLIIAVLLVIDNFENIKDLID